ncbi:MAG: MFS transporter [Clostridia bacterium]|nr:MFS transporter [Clostridia bacterium]
MKLNYKRTILIGFAFMAILAFWELYDQIVPYVLHYKFEYNTVQTNIIMSIDNILALFMLPLFGKISDKTKTPLGKRTPYILFGTIASVAALCALAVVEGKQSKIGFIIVLMILLVAMSTYRSPAVAYMPDVTEKPLRSKGNAIINLVGYIGGIFTTVVMWVLAPGSINDDGDKVYSPDQSFSVVFLVVAAFMLVAMLVMVLTVKENKILAQTNIQDDEPEVSQNGKTKLSKPVAVSLILILVSVFFWWMSYNGITTMFSRYCQEVWGVHPGESSGYKTIAMIAAIIAFVPLGLISNKIGRKKSVLFGIALMTVCYTGAFFIQEKSVLMYIIFSVVGIGWAAINVNSFPMVVEMCTGSDVGKYTGYYYTFSMAAQIVTPLLSAVLIDNVFPQWGYKILFPYAVIFSAASFVTMCFVRHGDSKPEAKAAIAEQFAADN